MAIRHSYLGGNITKDSFDMVSRLYKKAKGEMTSDQREAAEATRAASAAATLYGDALPSLSDNALFKEPPPSEDCPICFLPQPLDADQSKYQSCCGKVLCGRCLHAAMRADDRLLCPFCRTPVHCQTMYVKRLKKRVEANEPASIHQLECHCAGGGHGFATRWGEGN